MTTDESEKWAVIDDGGAGYFLNYEGMCNEYASKFWKMKVIEVMMAIDPDTGQDDPVDPSAIPEVDDGGRAAVKPDVTDVADVAELGSTPPADVVAELVSDGWAPPIGWRRDDFPAGGPVIRKTVWAPPWSLRPPNVEPEVWLSQSKKIQSSEALKLRDPVGVAAQQERWRFYNKTKSKGKVKRKAAIDLCALACAWFLDTPNGRFYDDPHDTDDPTLSCFLDEPEPCGNAGKGGRGGLHITNTCLARSGCSGGEVEQAARIFATVPALRAMSCQMKELDDLLLQAK